MGNDVWISTIEDHLNHSMSFVLNSETITILQDGDIQITGNYIDTVELFIKSIITNYKSNISDVISEGTFTSNISSKITIFNCIEIYFKEKDQIVINYIGINPPKSLIKFKKTIDAIQNLRAFI